MNREFKFRVYDENMEDMLDWETVISEVETEHLFISMIVRQKHYTAMQYTGLKDKNGVEIYEGDIVKFFSLKDFKEVVFKDGAFGYLTYGDSSLVSFSQNYSILKALEVIGNIYENKELLDNK